MSTVDICETVKDSFGQCEPLKKIPRQNEEFFHKIIKPEEVRSLARSAISTNAEVVDYYLRPYSEEKLGFLANHQCLIVVARVPGIAGTRMRSFFVKSMPYDMPGQVAYIEAKGAFRKEVNFFKSIVPTLMDNFRGQNWVPRAYLVKDDVLVFEDLKCEGFSNKPRFLDLESIKCAVASIAQYHAASLLAIKRLGKPLNEVFPEALEESEYRRTPDCLAWFNTALNFAVAVGKELGLDVSSMRRVSHRVYDLAVPDNKKRNVVGHGDLWSNNLMFNASNDCRIVDFQLIRYAPLAHDVMQLIYLTMTRELRGTREREVIEHYYANLVDCLTENGFSAEMPSFQELLRDVEEQRLWALLSAVFNFPTTMIDSKIGAMVMSDLEAYQVYFFGDRKPFVDRIMAQDPEYESSVKNIIREFAEFCAHYDC